MITGYIYLPKNGDREILVERRDYYRSYTKEQLIDSYNHSCSIGFFGHGQALEIIALRAVFLERFKDSPIIFTDNVLIEFSGPIKATETGWTHVETKS